MLDRVEPAVAGGTAARVLSPEAPPRNAISGDSFFVSAVVWLLIGIYVAVFAHWAWFAGIKLRDDAYTTTRTVRFHGDISNGFKWGSQVLRIAEGTANAKLPKGAIRASADPGKNQRPLTFWEVYRGVDQLYQNMLDDQSTSNDYRLDYPPLRLLGMTLWTWNTWSKIHEVPVWPGAWELKYDPKGDPKALLNEEIAAPVLMANTLSIAVTAACMFFLVWIWTNRGGRPALGQSRSGWTALFLSKKLLAPWKPVPIRNVRGLLVFVITAPVFFYAVVIAESPTPPPAPAVQLLAKPVIFKSGGKISAVLSANINGQGSDAQWHVDWGRSLFYTTRTPNETATNEEVSYTLRNLPADSEIHYRLTASNEAGITHTDDCVLNTANAFGSPVPAMNYNAVWLDWPQWLGIGVLFLAMSSSLKLMHPIHRGWAAGLAAAMLLWFDPGVLVDAHIWPQWDVWLFPPFFLAALLATLDWWLLAGVVLGVGVMFKGQLLMTGPLLILWPLFAGRWGAVVRMAVGFVTAAGLVLSPWVLLGNIPPTLSAGPLRWVIGIMAAAALAGGLSLYRRPLARRAASVWEDLKDEWHGRQPSPEDDVKRFRISYFDLAVFCVSLLAAIVCVTMLILRRWPTDSELPARSAGLGLLLLVLAVPWFIPRRALGVWLALVLGCSIWMGGFLYHGDWTWKSVGFEYGTRKFLVMVLGAPNMGNVPGILRTRFQWDINDPAFTVHLPDLADVLLPGRRGADGRVAGWMGDWGLDGMPITLDIRQFLMLAFVVLMGLAAVGAAIQARRNDPRFLSSLAAVWTLMPCILCQMAQRYQMFGGAASCVLIALSPGLSLMHILISLIGAGIIWVQLLSSDASRSPQIRQFLNSWGPDNGWIILVCGLVFLYVALAPARRPSGEDLVLI